MNGEDLTTKEMTEAQYVEMRNSIYNSFHLDLSYDFSDYLKSIGINILTGEACGLSMRLLCDIDDKAQRLLSDFFGGVEFKSSGWNSYEKKSIILTRSTLNDIIIYSVCEQYPIVIKCSYKNKRDRFETNHLRGLNSREELEKIKPHYDRIHNGNFRVFYSSGTSASGMRNRHEFSGRVE